MNYAIGVPSETLRHVFPSAVKYPSHVDSVCFQVQTHLPEYPVWYVRALPANGGDYEWTADKDKAKLLGFYWQKRFLAFCRRDYYNRPNYGCLPVDKFGEQQSLG
jgi:hypothetical protein